MAAALAASLGLAFACSPPEPLPQDQIERARAALRRARIEAAAGAPAELAKAIAASTLLERRLAERQTAALRPRKADDVEQLALAAESSALAALRQARLRQALARKALAAQRSDLEERLSALSEELEHMPGDQRLRAHFERARLELELEKAAERRGDLGAAAAGNAAAAGELAAAEGLLDSRYARLRDPSLRRRWQSWVDAALAASREGGTGIVVDKLARQCFLLARGRVVAVFPAELGRNGLAEKLYAGDAATPEGRFRVVGKREGEATRYHRALMLDYPTEEDLRAFGAAKSRGLVPAGRGIGGLIELHGHGGREINWTSGCVALRDEHMDRLFAAVEVGTPVTIVGTAHLPGAPESPR
ncbi:MAG TPA: L,D-transpeptidase [Thermoanaerobaculia bacterium]|nr:L,D-transpeptidase [Thermoanaerobaculia bacterium]